MILPAAAAATFSPYCLKGNVDHDSCRWSALPLENGERSFQECTVTDGHRLGRQVFDEWIREVTGRQFRVFD